MGKTVSEIKKMSKKKRELRRLERLSWFSVEPKNETLKKEDLPILLCGYTPCFRREAGTYGKETKGLNRLHQFDKIELLCITTQEDGHNRLEIMKKYIPAITLFR